MVYHILSIHSSAHRHLCCMSFKVVESIEEGECIFIEFVTFIVLLPFLVLFIFSHGFGLPSSSFVYSNTALISPTSFVLLLSNASCSYILQVQQYKYIHTVSYNCFLHQLGEERRIFNYAIFYNNYLFQWSLFFHVDMNQSWVTCFHPEELLLVFPVK